MIACELLYFYLKHYSVVCQKIAHFLQATPTCRPHIYRTCCFRAVSRFTKKVDLNKATFSRQKINTLLQAAMGDVHKLTPSVLILKTAYIHRKANDAKLQKFDSYFDKTMFAYVSRLKRHLLLLVFYENVRVLCLYFYFWLCTTKLSHSLQYGNFNI